MEGTVNDYGTPRAQRVLFAIVIGGLLSLFAAVALAEEFDITVFMASHKVVKYPAPAPCTLNDVQYFCVGFEGDDTADAYFALWENVYQDGTDLVFYDVDLVFVFGVFKDDRPDITLYARKEAPCVGSCA